MIHIKLWNIKKKNVPVKNNKEKLRKIKERAGQKIPKPQKKKTFKK